MPVVRTGFGDVPLYFEENRGQSDFRARYIARGRDGIAFIENDGLMLAFGGEAVEMRIANASDSARPEAEGEIEGVSNYYLGKLSLLGLRHYPGVRVRNVRPGVDIFYHGDGDRLEYDLEIHPGAAPDELKLVFSGAKPRLAENGDLVFDTPSGELRQQAPKVWQITDGRKRAIECRYRLATSGEVRLELSPYDRRADLVIDPVLSYSTYLSGSNGASPAGIAVDSGGSAFVIGQTYSSNFPVTTGPPFSSSEAFVTKFNHSGKGLVYSTFIVGSYSTTVTAVAVDSGDNAYVTGSTNASTFPFTIGQLNASGLMDAYVLKLGPTGNVVYGTDLGGNQSDFGNAIAVDASGEAFVAGSTSSNNFPTTTGVFHATRTQTSSTGFVAKLNSTGQISYATYLGGTNNDNPTSIAVDASGNAYIEGTTNSQDFPTTSGALSTALDGSQDAFVAKINPTGSALVYSTYLGGSSSETGGGLAIDAAGDCYVTGTTNSTDFPVTAGAFATSLPQFQTGGFVTKLNATGTALVYSTYLAGSLYYPVPIVVDSNGFAYVAGTVQGTFSTTPGALRTAAPPGYFETDAFLVKLASDGTALSYSTLLGSAGSTTFTWGLAMDSNSGLYFTGTVSSVTFPTTTGAFEATDPASFGTPGFVAKIDFGSAVLCTPSLSPSSINLPGRGGAFSFNLTLAAGCPWEAIPVGNNAITVNAPTHGVVSTSPVAISGTVAQNNSTSSGVTLTLGVGAATFTVNQAAGSCADPVLSLTSANFDSSGGIRNVSMVLPSQCSWTAVSNQPWLTITSAASGTGPATLTMFVGQNSFATRNAIISIASKTISVTQTGLSCTDVTGATPTSFSAAGGTGTATISPSSSSCSWSAYNTTPWIQIAPAFANGQGAGMAAFVVAPNPGLVPRTGSILIGDQQLIVSQSAGPAGAVSNYTSSVFAGSGPSSGALGDGGPATSAYLSTPEGVAFDGATGNLYIVDSGNARIRVVTPDGNINTFAGGGASQGENVPALSAQIISASRVAVDSSSSVYYNDSFSRVRKIAGGMVNTFAGTTTQGFAGDKGTATSAQLRSPMGMAADSSGNLYIADEFNSRIRIVSGGNIDTFAGGGTNGLGDNGPAASAMLANPADVAFGANSVLYIADLANSRIREVSQGTISTLIANEQVSSIALDPLGDILAAPFNGIIDVSPAGAATTINNIPFGTVGAMTTDPAGDVYYSLQYSGEVIKLTPAPAFCTYALGNVPSGQISGAGGPVSISVSAANGCNWAAYSPASWTSITSGGSGSGNGTLQLTFAANSSGAARTASVAVAGQVVLITQGKSTTNTAGSGEIGIFRGGTWVLNSTGSGSYTVADLVRSYGGVPGDIPVFGDWNGDGTTKIGIYRNGTWILDTNGNGQWDPSDAVYIYGGVPGDIPVVGDWNGSGTTKIGVYRSGTWIVDTNGNGAWDPSDGVYGYGGLAGDVPVVGDWNGTGTSKIGIYRHGTWVLDSNGNNGYDAGDQIASYGGLANDIPVVGKWAGSLKSLIGIYRHGTWILDSNGNNAWDPSDTVTTYGGLGSDLPVVGKW